jgi:hypothetical protein
MDDLYEKIWLVLTAIVVILCAVLLVLVLTSCYAPETNTNQPGIYTVYELTCSAENGSLLYDGLMVKDKWGTWKAYRDEEILGTIDLYGNYACVRIELYDITIEEE